MFVFMDTICVQIHVRNSQIMYELFLCKETNPNDYMHLHTKTHTCTLKRCIYCLGPQLCP